MKRHALTDSLPLFEEAPRPTFLIEEGLMRDGYEMVCGLDEAGRGPLAGPVVASAVILDPHNIPDGLHDSKQLTAARREHLFELILASAEVAVASVSPAEIDRTNILRASLEAMRRAALSLHRRPHFALIDGRDVAPGLPCPAKALIKGDARSLSISAASIVAKVTRDRIMSAAGKTFPGYGFELHAGYGTQVHRDAINALGPCAIHRMTFRPLRKD
ncbi:ribonuclease HII [Rhizobium sp. KVB221]|uniref:Ribonuclease HII n=1 Tax=Rhizobium setariae TaxID=2801340 RepID=A0A936YIJ7_9HYPH|nr:ribonuclease HII [Rhizobium setariae]MBL0370753.1 ribonuclease HII [Rhizobium setariae]